MEHVSSGLFRAPDLGEGRGDVACHHPEPLHGSSVTLFFLQFLLLGMGICVLCLSHHHGMEADNSFSQAHKWKDFFFLSPAGVCLVCTFPQPCELRSKVRNMALPLRGLPLRPKEVYINFSQYPGGVCDGME